MTYIVGRRFEDVLAERLAEDMFGTGPDERVRLLRESILGRGSPEGLKITGLLAAVNYPAEPAVK